MYNTFNDNIFRYYNICKRDATLKKIEKPLWKTRKVKTINMLFTKNYWNASKFYIIAFKRKLGIYYTVITVKRIHRIYKFQSLHPLIATTQKACVDRPPSWTIEINERNHWLRRKNLPWKQYYRHLNKIHQKKAPENTICTEKNEFRKNVS